MSGTFESVLNWFANMNASAEGLSTFFDELLQLGVYSTEELLLVNEAEIELFREADLTDRVKFWSAPDTFQTLSDDSRNATSGLKLFTDGAIGARSAAMTRPYLKTPLADKSLSSTDDNNFGMLLYSDSELSRTVSECFEMHNELAIHAIGDRAIEQVISTLESFGEQTLESRQIRLEHVQIITRGQAERAKALGIRLSMQPNFNADTVDYSDRIDEAFCMANNPFRMLIDEVGFEPGVDLLFGSDGMPHGIQFAAQQSLFPPVDTQRLSLNEMVAGYGALDESLGKIEIEIDETKRTVRTEVRL